ncbi:major facilitator superfamily domain-containing protein [Trichoderma asperelloides]|nr:major facilitator superfamily domain-containing protein [Trichoderma asperelloides]
MKIMALKFRRPTVPVGWLLPILVVNLFIISLGLSISDYPSTKLLQDAICKRHLGLTFDELLPESQCHSRAVQRELNVIEIGGAISGTLAGALVSLPLGMLADRVGRVPILALSILSLFISESFFLFILWRWRQIPLRATWTSGAILLLGGGQGVAEAMVFTSISDVTPESKRATCFQWVSAAVLSAELFGPLVASRLTDISIWHPLCISLGLIGVGGIILVTLMPETLHSRDSPIPVGEVTPIIRNNHHSSDDNLVSKTPMESTKSTFKALSRRPAVLLLPGAILAVPAVSTQYGIIMRLMPIQFDWPLSRAALLLSLNAAVTLITLLVILPLSSYALYKKTSSSALQRDRILARSSVILFVLGSFFLMMVDKASLIIIGVVLSGLGSGVPTLCRTLLVAHIGQHKTGAVFGVIAAGEVLGTLVCELVIGPLFNVGLRTWMGLPFCLGLGISIVTCLLTWLVRKVD